MEPALISGFGSVKWMRIFDSPWTGHYSIAGNLEGWKAELA